VEVEGKSQFFGQRVYFFVAVYPAFQFFYFFHLLFGLFGVVPKVGGLRAEFFLFELHAFGFDFKILAQVAGTLLQFFELFCCYHQ
jgi:hypothetical protein